MTPLDAAGDPTRAEADRPRPPAACPTCGAAHWSWLGQKQVWRCRACHAQRQRRWRDQVARDRAQEAAILAAIARGDPRYVRALPDRPRPTAPCPRCGEARWSWQKNTWKGYRWRCMTCHAQQQRGYARQRQAGPRPPASAAHLAPYQWRSGQSGNVYGRGILRFQLADQILKILERGEA